MITVLIVDDHPVVRIGLKEILADLPDLRVGGAAASAQEACRLVREGSWDLVVLDLGLPDTDGLQALMEIKRERPRLPVLILTMYPEDQLAIRTIRAGAAGYMTKESAAEELVGAIRKIVRGGRYFSPALAEKLVENLAVAGGVPHERLSRREYQVLRMIGNGRTVSQIASDLAISVKTVSTYRSRILQKMELETTAELIHYVARNRLIA